MSSSFFQCHYRVSVEVVFRILCDYVKCWYYVILLKFEFWRFTDSKQTPIFDLSEEFRSNIYHLSLTSIPWIQPIKRENFINIANVKNKDHRHLASTISRSLSKLHWKTELQALNNGTYLFRMPRELWDNSEASHQNYKSYWRFLVKNVTKKDLKGQVRRKYISPEKCLKTQMKDNPDTPW